MLPTAITMAALLARVSVSDVGCWLYMGGRCRDGYGQDNLYIYGRKRVCKTCIYARTRARRAGDAHETTSLSAA